MFLEIKAFTLSLFKRKKLIAVFSYRYDKALIPDLKKNLNSFVDDYVEWDDTKNTNEWYNEGEIRNGLIRKAKEKGADWILCIDPDERFEKDAGKKIRNLIKKEGEKIYSFNLRELWGKPNTYRNDGIWGKKRQIRLFPVLPNQQFMNLPVHSPWHPQNEDYEIIHVDINLYHLKMISPNNREDRKNLYNKLDPKKEIQKIGYDYLTDETDIELVTIQKKRGYIPSHDMNIKIKQTN